MGSREVESLEETQERVVSLLRLYLERNWHRDETLGSRWMLFFFPLFLNVSGSLKLNFICNAANTILLGSDGDRRTSVIQGLIKHLPLAAIMFSK